MKWVVTRGEELGMCWCEYPREIRAPFWERPFSLLRARPVIYQALYPGDRYNFEPDLMREDLKIGDDVEMQVINMSPTADREF